MPTPSLLMTTRSGWDAVKTAIAVLSFSTALLLAMRSGAESSWPMYQGNPGHDGYLATALAPEQFSLNWQRAVASQPLNPVTTAEGKVFVSLYGYFNSQGLQVLDAATGEMLWSKDFGRVFSVNPPAYANGIVYIQTGNHGNDTYLRAYDADDGSLVFQSKHSAQWERYFAPTIYDGTVYIDGGYYGGMYAFDASDGTQLWFRGLPQYDQWTPAVDEEHAYAYVGEYTPGLYVLDRASGQLLHRIDDPNFDWNGWSMNLAPVLGGAGDVIAIHDGRLIRFDLDARNIAWELSRHFVGQPCVARGVIYAIDSGALTAWDQLTGTLLWSWAPVENLTESVIVTDTHVIVGSSQSTYVVNVDTHGDDWSFQKGGHRSLGERTLYIASSDGVLTSINVGEPPDEDGDGFYDAEDNCPRVANPEQADLDGDGEGDACNDPHDQDGDEWSDSLDNCPEDFNPGQKNRDSDGFGDLCDPYPDDDDDLGACLLTNDGLLGTNASLHGQIDLLVDENAALREQLADVDGDGVPDRSDLCPESSGVAVDAVGCSHGQFCSRLAAPSRCNNADWKNDEPLAARDCIWQRNACGVR